MQRLIFTAFLILTGISSAFGQIELSYSKSLSLQGVTAPRLAGDLVLVGADSKPTISEVAIINVASEYKFVDVVAKKSLFDEGVLVPIGDKGTEFILAGEGRWLVQATAFDPEKGIAKKSIEVLIGPPPKPIEPIEPVVPPSDFASIAKSSRANADMVNDPATRQALGNAIVIAVASVPFTASLDDAKTAMVNAIENTLLLRTGNSRFASWTDRWRRPLNTAILAANITQTKDYLACMTQVAEALR
jgi:hypothetical protein